MATKIFRPFWMCVALKERDISCSSWKETVNDVSTWIVCLCGWLSVENVLPLCAVYLFGASGIRNDFKVNATSKFNCSICQILKCRSDPDPFPETGITSSIRAMTFIIAMMLMPS